MEERFCRTAMLIGETGLARLRAARVAVFGIGGVGSFAAEALARAGVGRLVLVDNAAVESQSSARGASKHARAQQGGGHERTH